MFRFNTIDDVIYKRTENKTQYEKKETLVFATDFK